MIKQLFTKRNRHYINLYIGKAAKIAEDRLEQLRELADHSERSGEIRHTAFELSREVEPIAERMRKMADNFDEFLQGEASIWNLTGDNPADAVDAKYYAAESAYQKEIQRDAEKIAEKAKAGAYTFDELRLEIEYNSDLAEFEKVSAVQILKSVMRTIDERRENQ